MLSEGSESDTETLAAAMLTATPDPLAAVADDVQLLNAATLASNAIMAGPGSRGRLLKLRLALALDTVRHLHMTELPVSERLTVWSVTKRLLPTSPDQSEARLTTLVAAWGERFERATSLSGHAA